MTTRSYPVEVKSDFLEKITRAKPVQALAEFIWNSLDADASTITVTVAENDLGAMSKIIIRDDGIGMKYEKASEAFSSLGGSWKRMRATTNEGRFLHGQDGRERFKAFALGTVAEWDVVYKKDQTPYTFMVTMTATNMREVVISDEEEVNAERARRLSAALGLPLMSSNSILKADCYTHSAVLAKSGSGTLLDVSHVTRVATTT